MRPYSAGLPSHPRSCPALRLGGWVKGRGSARGATPQAPLRRPPGEQIIGGLPRGRGAEPGMGQQDWVDDLLGSRGGDVIVMVLVICSKREPVARGEGSQPYLGPRCRGGAGDMMMDWVSPARGRHDRSFFRGRPRWPCTAEP